MNERIEELFQQAMHVEEPEGLFPREVFDEQKFAELIIRECVDRIQGCQLVEGYDPNRFDDFERGYQRAINKAASQVLLHFGVEQ